MPATKFADDNMTGLQAKTVQDVRTVLDVYKDFGKASGLKINQGKTELLAINTAPELIQQIETELGFFSKHLFQKDRKVVEAKRIVGEKKRKIHCTMNAEQNICL